MRVIGFLLVLVLCLQAPAWAGPIPSRSVPLEPATAADVATVREFLSHPEVTRALERAGVASEDWEDRLAGLSAEDLAHFADNVEQLQAAGDVPTYIWLLLAALIVVTILTAL
ncbi:MAG: PA2779 family protein [Thermoanaerobaculia bacterium]|nr:PA2779 family protein [Thermoanaerobaculia bacterium]